MSVFRHRQLNKMLDKYDPKSFIYMGKMIEGNDRRWYIVEDFTLEYDIYTILYGEIRDKIYNTHKIQSREEYENNNKYW